MVFVAKGLQNILLLCAGLNPSGIKLLFRPEKIVTGRGKIEIDSRSIFLLESKPNKKTEGGFNLG